MYQVKYDKTLEYLLKFKNNLTEENIPLDTEMLEFVHNLDKRQIECLIALAVFMAFSKKNG